jgi:hypothetical protein
MFMMAPPTDSHDTKMKNNHGFPRILHYIWPNKDFDFGPDDVSHAEQRRTLEIIDRIRHNNPDWTVIIWTDNECHEFMKQHFSHNYSDWISLKPKLKQWDAIRPCILWTHGGIYLDHDVDCNNGVKFDDWIHVDTKLLLRAPVTHSRNKIGNHFMGSTPHHPLWKLYLSNIWRETNLNYSVVRHTGPLQLYNTFQEYVANNDNKLVNNSIQLLNLHQFENIGECERITNNHTYCIQQPHCIHLHSVSPAELKGQDDNADYQLSLFRNQQQPNYTKIVWACQRLQQMTDTIFIHVPKTGGTSIEHAFGFGKSSHATARDYRECNPQAFDHALTFAVIRNPVERLVSLYTYAKKGGNGGKRDEIKYRNVRNLTLDEFIIELPNQTEINFAPQSYFIADDDGNVMVNEVLCTETLSEDWARLQVMYPNIKKLGALPRERLRSSSSQVTVNQVSHLAEKRIRELFEDDFGLWEKYCGNKTEVSSVT